MWAVALSFIGLGHTYGNGDWRIPESKPTTLARMTVAKSEKAADKSVLPRISGACLNISRFWLNILKPKERMTTPKKLNR